MNEESTRVLVADDDPQMQLAIKTSLSRSGYDVTIVADGKAASEFLNQNQATRPVAIVVSDQRMPNLSGLELLAEVRSKYPELPFVMITAYGTVTDAVDAMQRGASDFITKPFTADDLVRVVERCLSVEAAEIRRESSPRKLARPIVTTDPLMIRILEVSEAVARSDATVMIAGESGTGKELVARLIHTASPRVGGAFVAVNCAALPENLLESELFGHEKGAFTGAQQRKLGKFELAHGGTILLDEVSEMPLLLQAKLLRVLQEREVDRVGGREPISINVRVVATTNRNMDDMVANGQFRSDLFYRLNVIPVTLPPLRERKGDVKLLTEHFMRKYLGDKGPKLSAEVLAALESYPWPGNIRELQNAVERAAILSSGRAPNEQDFLLGKKSSRLVPEVIVEPSSSSAAANERGVSQPSSLQSGSLAGQAALTSVQLDTSALLIRAGVTVEEMEKRLILETLKATQNNRTQASKMLGISIRTLRNKLHEYRMEAPGDDADDSTPDGL